MKAYFCIFWQGGHMATFKPTIYRTLAPKMVFIRHWAKKRGHEIQNFKDFQTAKAFAHKFNKTIKEFPINLL